MTDATEFDSGEIVVDTTRAKIVKVAGEGGSGTLVVMRPSGLAWVVGAEDLRYATEVERRDWDLTVRMLGGMKGSRRLPAPVPCCDHCGALQSERASLLARNESTDKIDEQMVVHAARAHP
ncbi:hypothetical protein [Streptomyces kanamyceticus]|uniref:Uncharacterized protein n=1 Tax=Streptomyces kanamyceticus TaxID=1967 RepID=A0A5J6GL47_STRKN|nr:hypothetical protein [Streptomyces kanamyceticus]QEU93766.1 hypothetical protein CP970_25245 [Streptomyces kanamyceticus]